MEQDGDDDWLAENKRLNDLSDPVNPQDAMIKRWVEQSISSKDTQDYFKDGVYRVSDFYLRYGPLNTTIRLKNGSNDVFSVNQKGKHNFEGKHNPFLYTSATDTFDDQLVRRNFVDNGDETTLNSSKAYANQKVFQLDTSLKSYVDTSVEFKDGSTVPNNIDLSYDAENSKVYLRNNSKDVFYIDSQGQLHFQGTKPPTIDSKPTNYIVTKSYVDSKKHRGDLDLKGYM